MQWPNFRISSSFDSDLRELFTNYLIFWQVLRDFSAQDYADLSSHSLPVSTFFSYNTRVEYIISTQNSPFPIAANLAECHTVEKLSKICINIIEKFSKLISNPFFSLYEHSVDIAQFQRDSVRIYFTPGFSYF